MESFFGIGLAELIFIAIIALIVLGPERLPGAIRTVTNVVRQIRNLSNELTSQFSEEFKALDEVNPKNLIKELGNDLLGEDDPKNSKKVGAKPGSVKTGSTRTSATTSGTKTATRPATAAKPSTAATTPKSTPAPAKKVVASSADKAGEKVADAAEKAGEAGGVAGAAAVATKTAVTDADTGEAGVADSASDSGTAAVSNEANEKVAADKTQPPTDTTSASESTATSTPAPEARDVAPDALPQDDAQPKNASLRAVADSPATDSPATDDPATGRPATDTSVAHTARNSIAAGPPLDVMTPADDVAGTQDNSKAPSADKPARQGGLPGLSESNRYRGAGFKAGSIPKHMGVPAKSRKPADTTETAESAGTEKKEAAVPAPGEAENSILPPAMASPADAPDIAPSAADGASEAQTVQNDVADSNIAADGAVPPAKPVHSGQESETDKAKTSTAGEPSSPASVRVNGHSGNSQG